MSALRMAWKLVFLACLAYAAVCLSLYLLQGRLLYFPDRSLSATPAAAGLAYRDVAINTSDGLQLHGWLVPGRAQAPVLLFFHGNAGNISHRLDSLLIFHRLGLSTLIVDYRGYGRSQGKPSEHGTYLDADAAWRYLRRTLGVEAERIVVFGRSLGGAVAAWMAAHAAPGGAIIESSFTSVPDLASKIYPWLPVRLLSRFSYDTEARIAAITCPVLIAHSREDELIPASHGRALFAAAREPKRYLELRGGHNNGFLHTGDAYLEGLGAFLEFAVGYHWRGVEGEG